MVNYVFIRSTSDVNIFAFNNIQGLPCTIASKCDKTRRLIDLQLCVCAKGWKSTRPAFRSSLKEENILQSECSLCAVLTVLSLSAPYGLL